MKVSLFFSIILLSFSGLTQDLKFLNIIDSLDLSSECKSRLSSIYDKGENLSSEVLKESIVNIKEYNKSIDETRASISGVDFYHYTDFDFTSVFKTKLLKDNTYILINKKGYDDIFSYLKRKRMSHCCSSATKNALFIAEDSESSAHFGDYRLKVVLKRDTQILIADKHGKLLSGHSWVDVFDKLDSKYPGLSSSCKMRSVRSIIAEDSGADLIAYENWRAGQGRKRAWFILLNSRSVDYSEFSL